MSKKRIKIKPATNRDEAEALAYLVACGMNEERRLTAVMDAELLATRKIYEEPLSNLRGQIEGRLARVQAWAEANPQEFGKKKSIEFEHSLIGFQTGNHKLKLLKKWNWKKALAELLKRAPDCVRLKQEVDKARIIAARKKWLPDALREMGMEIVQDETFYLEPKLTKPETRQTAPAEAA